MDDEVDDEDSSSSLREDSGPDLEDWVVIPPGFTVATGKTAGCDEEIKKYLMDNAWWTETNLKKCDVILAVCPITSRVGTDIEAAESVLRQLPAVNKRIILVVLHHTFNRDAFVPESRGKVTHEDIKLTVDCLFHESRGLLRCPRNDQAMKRISDFLADL